MQPSDKLDLSPLKSKLEVTSLTDQEHGPRPVESSPVALVNSPLSPAVKAGEPQPQSETAMQQLDLATPSRVRKERRRNKTSSSVANVAEHEPTKTCKRLRLKHKEEEEGPEKKGKEVVENEAAVFVDDESAPKVWNLRPRKVPVPENMQKDRQCGSASGSKVDPKAAYVKKFSLSLTKKEIEEDFLLMTGRKPAQRPNKRTNEVKKQIPGLKMGSRLKSVCAETYAVREGPSTKWIR